MIKNIFRGIALVFIFALIVFITKNNIYTIPLMLIIFFINGLFSQNFKCLILSILPVFIVWIVHLFLKDSIISLAILYLALIPLFSFLGFFLKNSKFFIKILIILITIPIGTYIYPNWFALYENRYAVIEVNSPTLLFKINDQNIRLDTIKNKIIILDFWSTSCGQCINDLPKYQEISEKYKNNKNVLFYLVNIPNKKDKIGVFQQILLNKKINVNSLYSEDDKILDSLKFHSFPHLIILKNGKIRYSGMVILEKNKINYIENELKTIITEN